jgi:hypothetical protein
MVQKFRLAILSNRELLFQVVLHCLVFSFYSFDQNEPGIKQYQLVYFLNYALANALISYILLPRFFYRKKYVHFFTFALLTVAGVILVEEQILEKIYFPDSRGTSFPGVFFSLWEVMPVIVILSGFKFAWDAVTKQRELEALQAIIQESELEFLKSQINPHFLFNNLNNLYAYAIENSPKTPGLILELSSVLRYMLYECREKYVSLAKEVENLKSFTLLSELQIEDRGVVNFSTRNIQVEYQIAPLILIVFIENAFKHSQSGQSSDIQIDISIELTEYDTLNFRCSNNFYETDQPENMPKGIGLENVKKRLELIYPNAHQLDIIQTDNYYQVQLSMQLKKRISYELYHH